MSTDKEAEEKQKQAIAREYAQWKKSAPLLYDMIITQQLTWPSLTCQWLPQSKIEGGFKRQELLLGTHTNDEDPEFLEVHSFNVPEKTIHPNHYKANLSQVQKIPHEGEVNRARYQPHNADMIATKTRTGDVHIFDRSTKQEGADSSLRPILRLKGHALEGYGLAWNPHEAKKHHLISAGFEGLICHWDISMPTTTKNELEPLYSYHSHKGPVNDVSWNSAHDSIFASVGDDKQLMIWDTRNPVKPRQTVQAHQDEILSVACHPKKEWLIATGSSDKSVALFDMRNMSSKLHSMEATHDGQVTQVAWSPHDEPIIASAGADRKIVVYDLRKIGQEQNEEDAEDAPPEVIFVHSGHTSRVAEFSWNPLNPWVIASIADDNVVQIWQMSKKIYTDTDQLEITPSQLE